uniref:Uncharacterized protein n=1 Tax=Octactis speculum TaxID=3111310 RepID=A0A7S2DGA1_9STRA|mmetsp:Transcript_48547/g.66100  ORF Transcript_48547/g.66100 Transcript_48547/m.66100 type:complete len:232 (+) Transcript_48547:91-786(+)
MGINKRTARMIVHSVDGESQAFAGGVRKHDEIIAVGGVRGNYDVLMGQCGTAALPLLIEFSRTVQSPSSLDEEQAQAPAVEESRDMVASWLLDRLPPEAVLGDVGEQIDQAGLWSIAKLRVAPVQILLNCGLSPDQILRVADSTPPAEVLSELRRLEDDALAMIKNDERRAGEKNRMREEMHGQLSASDEETEGGMSGGGEGHQTHSRCPTSPKSPDFDLIDLRVTTPPGP